MLLLALSSPLLLQQRFPGWYPDGLARLVLESYNVHVPLIAGVFAGAAVWEVAKERRPVIKVDEGNRGTHHGNVEPRQPPGGDDT